MGLSLGSWLSYSVVEFTRVGGKCTFPGNGIGAGSGCDGQVLVLHDIIGMSGRSVPKFARQYADVRGAVRDAVTAYAADVRSGAFPSGAESFHGSPALRDGLEHGGSGGR